MPKSRIILALGFFLALLPVLGFPNSWDHFFDTAAGLLIVLLSVLISVDRRLMLKAKAEKRTQRKRAVATPPTPAEEPVPPKPEIKPEPIFSMPEVSTLESAPAPIFEPAFDEPRFESFSAPESESVSTPAPDAAPEPRPKRKRRVKVLDADASAPETPSIAETFDTNHTEF